MRKTPRRWAVFISGRGSNLQALLDLGSAVEIRWVVSSRATAPGLMRARRAGIPFSVLPPQIDWVWLDQELRRRGIQKIFLAGFMKLIPADFLKNWEGKILNVHPSLLPAYSGLKALEKSFEEKADMGVTVHVVTPEMDAGPRLSQRKISRDGLDLQEASWAIARMEHRLVREAVLR